MVMAITLQDFGKETVPDHFYTKNKLYKLILDWFTIDATGSNGLWI